MKLKSILYILMVLPFLWSCNNEDDLDEIFVSGTWYVVNYYTKANWDRREGTPKYKPSDSEGTKALQIIQKFTLHFKNDGSLTGEMQNKTFEGTWEADGKDRTVKLTFKGLSGLTSYNKEYIETLTNATFYNGDSNYLMLGPEDKKSFIQFRHN